MSEKTDKPAGLSAHERAKRVLRSQGYAIGLLTGLPKDIVDALAAFTTPEGQVRPSAVDGVREVLAKHYAESKSNQPPASTI